MIDAERSRSSNRVLGIDPGLAKVGWGVVIRTGRSFALEEYGVIRTRSAQPHAERLLKIYRGLEQVIADHRPTIVAVEEVFQGKSARSALLAGEGRGACILSGAIAGLPVVEYAATSIKQAITGNGRASKVQVQSMVALLLNLETAPQPDDSADALAVAITHLQRSRGALEIRPS